MDPLRFLEEVIEPNVIELSADPTSMQRVWNAVVSILQIEDYLAIQRGTKPTQEFEDLARAWPRFQLVKDIGNALKHAERKSGTRRGLSAYHVKAGRGAAFSDGTYYSDGTSHSDARRVLRIEFNGELVDLVHLCKQCVTFLRSRM